MDIHGIGIISSVGRGLESFLKALQQDPIAPKTSMCSLVTKKKISAFRVDDSLLKDKEVLKNSRRADRFCKMAVLSACDAFLDSNMEVRDDEKIGVIVATAFGPHKTTFNFLDNILDYGEAGVSPTIFSHSVHNAAASYITAALNIHGPVCTLTDFNFPFHEACKLADSWINQGRCKYVLVGTVDELSPTMEYICDQKLNMSNEAKTAPGEGSAFFLLGKEAVDTKYCALAIENELTAADVCILEADGMRWDESIYKEIDIGDAKLFNAYPLFGGMMSSSSFHCVSGTLMLKENQIFSKYARGLPHDDDENLSHIACLKYGHNKEMLIISLTK